MNHKYINYLQIVKGNPAHFKLILVYEPCPYEERSRHQHIKEEMLTSGGSVYIQMPLAFTLMVVAQMQILVEGFGELLVSTCTVRGAHQNMKIQFGATYLEHIQESARLDIESWLMRVSEAISSVIDIFNQR